VSHFWQDLVHATHALRRRPGFVAIVALTLALGVGANTAVFTIVHEHRSRVARDLRRLATAQPGVQWPCGLSLPANVTLEDADKLSSKLPPFRRTRAASENGGIDRAADKTAPITS
jgi:hypothetical protein